jgi:hypothetical protein
VHATLDGRPVAPEGERSVGDSPGALSFNGSGLYRIEVTPPGAPALPAREYAVAYGSGDHDVGSTCHCNSARVGDEISLPEVVPSRASACVTACDPERRADLEVPVPFVRVLVSRGDALVRYDRGAVGGDDGGRYAASAVTVSYRAANAAGEATCRLACDPVEARADARRPPPGLEEACVAACDVPWSAEGTLELTARLADGREARRTLTADGPVEASPPGRGVDAWTCCEGRARVVGFLFD